jgi:ATP-dependent Clp endopeptidase proteolytic subunit ClpP
MYTLDYNAAEPIMLIDQHIGYVEGDGYGVDGAAFARELMELDRMGKNVIHIWINSPGGKVMDGYSIYNAILASKAKVNTKCVGIAASIAAVIFQAGRERIMCDYGILMYHNPFSMDGNNDNDPAIVAMRNSIVTMISSRSGMTSDAVAEMMARETFMGADEALALKLADRIEGSAEYNKKRMTAVAAENNAQGYYKEARTFLNQLFKTEHMPDFAKIANRLKLVPAANEDAIIEGIAAIENRANTAETQLTAVRNQLTERDATITTLTSQLNTMKGEKEAAEKASKKVAAENLVKGFVKVGTIKNDAESVAKWTDRAIADFEGTKDLLESIPVNRAAKKIITEDGTGVDADAILDNACAMEMGSLMNKLSKKN